MDCLFCKIISGEIPSTKIYENANVLAFKDITPQAPIHYLFVPKLHVENLEGLSADKMSIMGHIFHAIQTVARQEGFAEKGYRTAMNTNGDGCQSVYHLHVHLMAGKQLGGNMSGIKT